nr:global nitrogen transcriptional regulator [Boldiaceae sp.]
MYYNHFHSYKYWSCWLQDKNFSSETINIKKGDTILLNNPSLVYINLKGIISISKKYDTNKFITLYLLTSSNCIFFLDTKINSFLEGKALTSSTLLVISRKDFIILKKSYPSILKLELNSLKFTLNFMESFIIIFYHKNIRARLLSFFLIMSKNFGLIYYSCITINFPISHQDIAKIIGASRVSVTRIINELKKKLIIIYKQKITIQNPVHLSHYILNSSYTK